MITGEQWLDRHDLPYNMYEVNEICRRAQQNVFEYACVEFEEDLGLPSLWDDWTHAGVEENTPIDIALSLNGGDIFVYLTLD